MKTKSELLHPRFLVKIDYPESVFKVGDIIEQVEIEEGQNLYNMDFFHKYPIIFKPLEWWEFRNINDMPEYVKMLSYIKPLTNNPEHLELKNGQVFSPDKWVLNSFEIGHFVFAISLVEPATKEEYEQFT